MGNLILAPAELLSRNEVKSSMTLRKLRSSNNNISWIENMACLFSFVVGLSQDTSHSFVAFPISAELWEGGEW